jgi:hypothetical protein
MLSAAACRVVRHGRREYAARMTARSGPGLGVQGYSPIRDGFSVRDAALTTDRPPPTVAYRRRYTSIFQHGVAPSSAPVRSRCACAAAYGECPRAFFKSDLVGDS